MNTKLASEKHCEWNLVDNEVNQKVQYFHYISHDKHRNAYIHEYHQSRRNNRLAIIKIVPSNKWKFRFPEEQIPLYIHSIIRLEITN